MEIRIVTGGELERFFIAKGIKTDCPACGKQGTLSTPVVPPVDQLDADVDEATMNSYPAVMVLHHLHDNVSLGYGQFPQTCMNCGFIRYFRDIEVVAFLEGGNHNE